MVKQITELTIHCDRYNPSRGGNSIELLKWVSAKRSCINIKTEDTNCFKYWVQCSVFKLCEKDNPQRMRHYDKSNGNVNDGDCMEHPCSRTVINRFEELDSGLMFINVFKTFNESIIILYRITKVKKLSIILIF